MIQTTLLSYFKIIDCSKRKEKEKKQVFDIILVDIKSTSQKDEISCVKKNMHDKDLKYIAISYRWGEVDEQLIETPDYTAHITSFDIYDLMQLCGYIKRDADLKKIPYLWIDAISVDQQNHSRKKETILQMSKIYKRASYILAVPDLHFTYLLNNPENKDLLDLIRKYDERIANDIRKIIDQSDGNEDGDNTIDVNEDYNNEDYDNESCDNEVVANESSDNEFDANEVDDNNIKKIYRFLAYLVQDWANRAWVISECQIAKEKYQVAKEKKEKYGIPMKYALMSLVNPIIYNHQCSPFFSYSFDHQGININDTDYNYDIHYMNVDSSRKFNMFLKKTLTQRSYLDMLLNSKASRNEDRFNAILPSWEKYRHVIKDKNTIPSWQITDMVSVRLKLYEIMDDLWDKARLLYLCSHHTAPGFPTFAMNYINERIYLKETGAADSPFKAFSDDEYYAFKKQMGLITGISPNNVPDNEIDHSTKLVLTFYHWASEMKKKQMQMQIDRSTKINQFTNNVVPDNIIYAQIGDDNLIDIQLNNHGTYGYPFLSLKSKFCFYCIPDKEDSDRFKSKYPLKDSDDLIYVHIPFFIWGSVRFAGRSNNIGDVCLLGDENKNIWIVYRCIPRIFHKLSSFVSVDDYTFNVY